MKNKMTIENNRNNTLSLGSNQNNQFKKIESVTLKKQIKEDKKYIKELKNKTQTQTQTQTKNNACVIS